MGGVSEEVDRDGLYEILGYGGSATRLVGLLVGAGIGTPSKLKRATYGDLLDIPGLGEGLLSYVIESLEYHARTEQAHKEG